MTSSCGGASRRPCRGYTLTYLGSHTARSEQKTTISADVKVRHGDRVLGTYSPAISTFPNSTEGIGTPSVHTGLVEDVYLTLVSSPTSQQPITLGVRINPMIVWLWIGGGFMALGTILALAPRAPAPVASTARGRRRVRAGTRATRSGAARGGERVKHPARIVALAVALVVVVLGVVLALNVGNDPEQDAKQSHLVGKAAPAFDLPNLERWAGRRWPTSRARPSSSTSGTRGASRAEQEAPALQQFYAAHKDDSDFAMVGIVRDDTHRRRAHLREGQQRRVDDRARSAERGRARLRRRVDSRRRYAISPGGVVAAAKYGPMSSGELETFLAAARASE